MEKGIWKIIPQDALKHFRELGNSDLLKKKKINIKDKLWVSIWPCRFRLTLPWRNSSVHQLSKILLSVNPTIPQQAHPAQNIPCHKLFRILNSFFQISVLEDIKVVAPLLFLSLKSLSPTPFSMGGMRELGWNIWGALNHLEIAFPPRSFWAFPLESDNRQPTSVLKHWVVVKCELPTV